MFDTYSGAAVTPEFPSGLIKVSLSSYLTQMIALLKVKFSYAMQETTLFDKSFSLEDTHATKRSPLAVSQPWGSTVTTR